jgi:phosphatidylserine/phosphatidylglycerophosphate/cardiolipin synthase-like enzyme
MERNWEFVTRLRTFFACIAALLVLGTAFAGNIQVYFSPQGGCTEAVVSALDHATNSIYVQAYSFTSVPIAKALLDAKRRGLKVSVILDKSQRTEKYSSATFLKNEGISMMIDARHAIAHNKVMVIDAAHVLTGSFNFTKQAETSNAENLLVIDDPQLATKYLGNWQKHWNHSEPYMGFVEGKKRR